MRGKEGGREGGKEGGREGGREGGHVPVAEPGTFSPFCQRGPPLIT